MSPSAGFTTIPDFSGLGSSLSSRSILRTSPIGAVLASCGKLLSLFVLKLLDEPGEKLGGETCGRDDVSGIDDEDTGDGTGDMMYSPPSSIVDDLPNGLSRISSRSEFCNKDLKPTVGNFVVSTGAGAMVTLADEASLVDIVFFLLLYIYNTFY